MTAEVSIMNALGVSLAADSAVTVGSKAEKIYTSAEKLFQLSNSEPIGVMFYGNAFFTGLPWETIIKSYRRYFGSSKFDTVKEYGEDFMSWLGNNRELFPEDVMDRQIISLLISYFLYIQNEIKEKIDREAEIRDGLEEDDITTILNDVVKSNLKDVRSYPVLGTMPKDAHAQVRKFLRTPLVKIKKDIFGELPFKPSTRRLLTTLAVELLTREYLGPFKSGIVIAGYGEMEFMPALISYEVEEMILSKPRCAEIHHEVIEGPGDAWIIPFAQKDMVNSFMEGIDRELNRFMIETTQELFQGVLKSIALTVEKLDSKFGKDLTDAIDLSTETVLTELYEAWQDKRGDYWKPVINVVSSLPKEGLAEMAEALVNLTKFRRRVTDVPETVGGPIDVAVITKGDGFVWVRRKHYFDANLNPRFFAKFYKE